MMKSGNQEQHTMNSIPGHWVNAPDQIEKQAAAMLATNRSAPAVWVGVKRGTEPQCTIITRAGQRLAIEHSPGHTFSTRLSEALEGIGTGTGRASGSGDAAAEFVLATIRKHGTAPDAAESDEDRRVAQILGLQS